MKRKKGLYWCVLLSPLAFGTDGIGLGASMVTRPTQFHHTVSEQAQDCSVYRSIDARTRAQQIRARGLIEEALRSLESKRLAVDSCGKKSSIADEQLLAEVCSGPYQDWLDSGVELALVEEQAHDLKEQLGLLDGFLGDHCRRLPPGVILSSWRQRYQRSLPEEKTSE